MMETPFTKLETTLEILEALAMKEGDRGCFLLPLSPETFTAYAILTLAVIVERKSAEIVSRLDAIADATGY